MVTHGPTKGQLTWQVIEEVAGLLEKSLTPFAEVRTNVMLPVIGRPRSRQCDVVITYGSPRRQTVTIVEVQNRGSKPNINTFHGWCRKMQEVGAQNLICVSVKGYPKSIIDEVATTYGPTVRLLTLNELRTPEMPGLTFASPFLLHKTPHITLEQAGPGVLELEGSLPDVSVEFRATDKVFTVSDSGEFLTIVDVISLSWPDVSFAFNRQRKEEPDRYRAELTLGSKHGPLWLHINGQAYKVQNLPVTVRVETTVLPIPLTVLEYQQASIEGALASGQSRLKQGAP